MHLTNQITEDSDGPVTYAKAKSCDRSKQSAPKANQSIQRSSKLSAEQNKTYKPRKPTQQRRTQLYEPDTTLLHDRLSSEIVNRTSGVDSGLDPVCIFNRLRRNNGKQETINAEASQAQIEVIVASTTMMPPEFEARLLADASSVLQEKEQEKFPSASKNSSHTSLHTKLKRRNIDQLFSLDDFAALYALAALIEKHGRISHMGILDPSFSFFMSKDRQAALYYKIKNKIAIVGGNPLCSVDRYTSLLAEFNNFRKKSKLGIAFLGASDGFAKYAMAQKRWVCMRFGVERALNPLTNPILAETEGKRIIKQVKQLLDPQRGGLRVHVYIPAQSQDLELQQNLVNVYETWRNERNNSGAPQAYMTVFDPFALPHLMIYIYTTCTHGGEEKPNGFAALRRVDASGGYHIDPYCSTPDAPRGVTDLLIYSAMALLNHAGIQYLGLGFEPAQELTDIHAMSPMMARLSQSCYRRTFRRLPIAGKKAFHDKWRPDEMFERDLYIVYPDGRPSLRHSLAALHFANVSAKRIVKEELKDYFSNSQTTPTPEHAENLENKQKDAEQDTRREKLL